MLPNAAWKCVEGALRIGGGDHDATQARPAGIGRRGSAVVSGRGDCNPARAGRQRRADDAVVQAGPCGSRSDCGFRP